MTLDVYRGRKTTIQQYNNFFFKQQKERDMGATFHLQWDSNLHCSYGY